MINYEWELAGLNDSNGNLGRAVPSGHVLVPGNICLADEAISWSLEGPTRAQEVSRTALNEFVKLWASDAKSILGFAKKWGILAIRIANTTPRTRYIPCGEAMTEGSDPVGAWKYFSRRAFAVLNIAAALRQGKLGDLADWAVIAAVDNKVETMKTCDETHVYGMGWHLYPIGTSANDSIQRGKSILAKELILWLTCWRARRLQGISDFAVDCNPRSGRLELKIDYSGYLFAALALQLALTLVGTDNIYSCSGCAAPYVRELKRPKPGWGNYCPACSDNGIAQKRAAEAYRARKADAKRLGADGMAPEEIARQLGLPIPRVRKWLDPPQSTSKMSNTRRKKK